MKAPTNGFLATSVEGEQKNINSELWHACAGPLVSLPPVGSLVVYFPQGHSEQVAASMQKETDFIPNYPNLPSKLICMLHSVTLHADTETDEVYAQMTLQPVNKYDKEAILASDMGLKQSRQPSEFFCKTLTASDTSTHGGFSVPRRAAEKIFPPLDFSMQPPAQELVAKDLHDSAWTFRHIYRGQPKRHLLTTGWSVFVSTKRLFAGDAVLFIRDEKSQLLLGIRRANRQQPALSSSVISSDSMHIGILAAAAHAAANNTPFTIFYNPRASPSEFVVPLAKYNKAMYTQVSLGMRFRMMFETEESGVRRYMGTITGISELDAVRWKNSQWRNLQVGWDESTAGDRPSRVSIWEIEPVVTPFYICPPPFFRPKFPKQPGMPDDESDIENAFKRAMPWLGDEFGMKNSQSSIFPGLSLVQWMNMQQNNQFSAAQSGFFPSMVPSTTLHNGADDPSKLLNFKAPGLTAPSQLNKVAPQNQVGQVQQPTVTWPQQQQLQHLMQNPMNHQQQNHSQQQQIQQLMHTPLNQQQQNHPQQQLQQLMQTPANQQLQNYSQQQQQQQREQQLHQDPQGHQQLQQLHQLHQQQAQRQQQQQQQQQLGQPTLVSNGLVTQNQIPSQNSQQPMMFTQLQQQHSLTSSTQSQQTVHTPDKNSFQLAAGTQDSQIQQQLEPQPSLLQRQQQAQLQESPLQLLQQSQKAQQQPQVQPSPQRGLSEQQLNLKLLQKLQQQQQQQLFSPSSLLLQPQMLQQQLAHQQNQQLQQLQLPLSHHHQQQLSTNGFAADKLINSNNFSASTLMQPQHVSSIQQQNQQEQVTAIRSHSNLTEGDGPSCSTSPSTNNCQVSSSNLLNRNQQGTAMLITDPVAEPSSNLIHDFQSKSDIRIKHELPISKGPDQVKYKGTITDQLEPSSSGTSYCLDASTMQQNYALPSFCLDGDVQSHPRNSLPFSANVEGLAPDTLLSRGYDSQKDLQNLLANYGGTPRDIETELSTAAISSQSFGAPNMSFKPGCSSDVALNDAAVLNNGLWGSQAQRMRTYTKVQKRGSVGRCIDVTRYKGYDELRHDLARMFGIEGQLEDPHRTDWKLVYVDHENDILLVGDDPWEEFVSCVQSIKILSSVEVQQMSLDGDLGNVPVPNQVCSGTDSGNAWRAPYDDNSAASFNR
ncbi:auxin response factor 7-like isoform X2 [Argentina anserina]|uniref:auxin response factor 7-like isoform X2 n=1 Tax=Argentina anserina TaxID=57926 RepID=UPI002176201D|nr:auxin response factor 7-like isoform X2 [Potentilla anserina]